MKIKKTYQGVVPNGKILNSKSDSPIDTYSCNYLNGEDFSNLVNFNETPLNSSFRKIGNMIVIQFMGDSKVHSSGMNICTVPEDYRPKSQYHFPVISGATGKGNIVMNTNGQLNVNYLDNYGEDRLVFNIIYFID